MKKKVLSVVLASALFAGAAVSASAVVWGDWDSSSKSGDNADITDLAFTEASYTIRNGADPKNMLEVITAYAGDNKIVQEPDLEWEISENDLAFELNTEDNGATVAAFENNGSATITVTANDGKVKASCKVVAAPLIKATGFKFEKSTYTLPTGTYVANKSIQYVQVPETFKVKLVSTPTDAVFSDAQKKEFANMQIALVASKDIEVENAEKNGNLVDITKDTVVALSDVGNEKGEFLFQDDDLINIYAGLTNARLVVIQKKSRTVLSTNVTGSNTIVAQADAGDTYKYAPDGDYTKIDFPAYDSDKSGKTISRDVRASTETARPATRAGRSSGITLEVGQKADLGDYVKYGPSNANFNKSVGQWTIDYYNASSTDDDFAVLNDGRDAILAVAVGKVKAVATFTAIDGKTMEVEVPITVVARGANSKPETPAEPTTENAVLAIGGTYWVESGNANTTWTVDNDNVTILPEVGAGCKVFAKKAGTATVTGTVDGKVVKTVTITIEAAGATTPDVPAEANPSTGDSLLAFLF